MNDVLLQLKTILKSKLTGDFAVRKIECGMFQDSYEIFGTKDLPGVLIEPVEAPIQASEWANNLSTTYSVRIYVIFLRRNPQKARVTVELNQSKTLFEYSDEIIRILGANKKLNGKVRRQSDRFGVESFTDMEGRQVNSISVKYIDDLIPWESGTINQNNMIKQI